MDDQTQKIIDAAAKTAANVAATTAAASAVISTDISYIKRDIGEIKDSIKLISGVYATQVSVNDSNKAFDLRVKNLEHSSNLWKWLSPTLAAIVAIIVEYLFLFYIQHIR